MEVKVYVIAKLYSSKIINGKSVMIMIKLFEIDKLESIHFFKSPYSYILSIHVHGTTKMDLLCMPIRT